MLYSLKSMLSNNLIGFPTILFGAFIPFSKGKEGPGAQKDPRTYIKQMSEPINSRIFQMSCLLNICSPLNKHPINYGLQLSFKKLTVLEHTVNLFKVKHTSG